MRISEYKIMLKARSSSKLYEFHGSNCDDVQPKQRGMATSCRSSSGPARKMRGDTCKHAFASPACWLMYASFKALWFLFPWVHDEQKMLELRACACRQIPV